MADFQEPVEPARPTPDPQPQRGVPRLAAAIPVLVTVVHAWEAGSTAAKPAALLNVSQTGGAIQLAGVLPPRTRLRISLPSSFAAPPLLGDVVWTSALPGRRVTQPLYGLRWIEELPRAIMEALHPMLGPGTA